MRLGVDLFCGGGGATAGAEASGAIRTVFAANHWERACQTFRRNFPHARVARSRIDEVHPGEVEKLHVLHASPPCPGHSNGRGNKPTSDRERADPWDILKWFTHHKIEDAIIENVPGFVNWGPVDPKTGRPDPKHKGVFFNAWIEAIQACGHTVEYRKMDPADFGAKTSRPRLIVRTRLGKRAPKWPEPTHVGRWVACRDALDLTTKGRGIAGRICENTLRRIADGRAIYGDQPFLVEYYGNSSTASLDRPLPTITTHDRHGLVIGDTLRVLFNHELAKCQGFADDFVFEGNRTEVTTQIGNSVPPELSRALCLAIAG